MSVFVGRGRGVAPPLLDAVYGVHVYLHVLARLECLAADGAGVRQVARRVHVQYVLLEVAVVAVELAALGARGLARLTVSEGAAGGRVPVALVGLGPRGRLVPARSRAARPARPGRSWGRRRSRSVLATPNIRRFGTRLDFVAYLTSIVAQFPNCVHIHFGDKFI